ncbi:MAG TPA: TonB-dependent receptor [bacterium]|nr:TonB-dependent receptor [bacterium]
MRGRQISWTGVLVVFGVAMNLLAQTTGKIAGRITDASSGEGLAGANVIIEGTMLGAAAALDGSYFIINVPPGVYSLKATMMGYQPTRIEGVQVSVNRTTTQDVSLNQTVLETGDVVVVQADRMAIKRDQTSSIRNVSSEEIGILPVESTGAIIALQAGVVGGHFRGGRTGEVSYMIDGMPVDNTFSEGRGQAVNVAVEAVQDIEVISGTFNAEYGRAMSGMVNVVTKDGTNRFHGFASGYLGAFMTAHTGQDQFVGLDPWDLTRVQDYKIGLEGPILKDKITFFTNFRFDRNMGHINGVRRFNVYDQSNFSSPDAMFSTHTGDSSYVPLNWYRNINYFGKLTYRLSNFKVMLSYTLNDNIGKGYSHVWKYVPDGKAGYASRNHQYALQVNHMFSRRAFYELKFGYLDSDGRYSLYEDPLDPRYVSDIYRANDSFTGFYTGGQEKDYSTTKSKKFDAKFDLTWQINRHHSIKTGLLATQHQFDRYAGSIRNRYVGTPLEAVLYEPQLSPSASTYADAYEKEPFEFSAYLQDKMEFDEMVINFGVRYDYFNPNTTYPSNRRNPANQLTFADDPSRMSAYPSAPATYHLSPRFGLSYLLGRSAVLHFSYGHFFQIPPFERMYQNSIFLVDFTNFSTQMGNGLLKAERTVSYEVGLWQELMEGMGLEISLFYKDIYDLLTVEIFTTYNQIKYGVYGNKEYANARGLEVKYDFATGPIYTMMNYTLQFTRGVADNPRTTFSRAGQSQDPIPILIPLSWDQRHTFNASVGYNTPRYGTTLTAQYGSGQAYTWSPINESRLADVNLYPNNSWSPGVLTVDLRSHVHLGDFGGMKWKAELFVYNLFDRLNEYGVNSQTGRANQAIIRPADLASHTSDFNAYHDRIQNPANFSAPRQVKLGIGVTF